MFWGRLHGAKFLDGAAFGAFLSSVFFLILFWLIDIADGEPWHQYLTALMVTVATLGAASIAVYTSRIQIQQNGDQERQRQEKSNRAAVAMLPLALSNMSEVCCNNMKRHFSAEDLVLGGAPVMEFMAIDSETVAILKECIQFGDDYTQMKLANMIRAYQVLRARNEGIRPGRHVRPDQQSVAIDHELTNDVLHWATLHALVDNAYSYARGEVETIARDWDKDLVRNAMETNGIDMETFPNINAIYESRLEKGRLEMFRDRPGT
ncbi:hypothetical protein LB577_14725 [Mesorhizobium sp. B283B1A]|uniref:hypothetical protein n=1 Tax=Mesorhizobium TaxID=68287 RepID=UPI001CD0A735|nr:MULTISPECIES: hypothetical protein [Mesorhizobium]MCA0048198.1 hypothetical protein [Mesorhizobium sp. B283B1A]UQS67446.1 hypothetical protein M5D98_14445 [Mesorhizobium opportunistum]